MTQLPQNVLQRARVKSLMQDGKYEEALAVLDRQLKENPLDLECRLHRILLNTKVRGPERLEEVVDAIRNLPDIDERKGQIVREILRLEEMRAYQRILGELLLDFQAAQKASEAARRPWKIAAKNLAVLSSAGMLLLMPLTYYVFGNGKLPAGQTADAAARRPAVKNMIPASEGPRREEQNDSADEVTGPDRALAGQDADLVQTSTPKEITLATGEPQRDVHSDSKDGAARVGIKPASRSAAPAKTSTKAALENVPGPVREIRRAIPIREKPSFAAATVQKMSRGAKIKVLGTEGNWLKIQTQEHGKIGFVRKEFTTPLDPPQH